jgi:hypothetical protein
MDGNHFLDGGARRLVAAWKTMMRDLRRQRDGETVDPADPALEDLMMNAGSSQYKPKRPAGMSQEDFDDLSRVLAPIESDGPDDDDEWNLFHQYLVEDPSNPVYLNQPHLLSLALNSWKFDRVSRTILSLQRIRS